MPEKKATKEKRSALERLKDLTRRIVAVPKSEVESRKKRKRHRP